MKVTVNIDCTPEEARAFLGLPDVRPMQERLMRELEERLAANIRAMDPEAMLRTWLPATLKGFEQLQEILMAQMTGAKREWGDAAGAGAARVPEVPLLIAIGTAFRVVVPPAVEDVAPAAAHTSVNSPRTVMA
jgi:uncharacterized protein DUF6489